VPEYHQQAVGLFVHDKPERFHYVGSASLDIPDLIAFNIQQTLPYTAEDLLKGFFSEVVVKKDPSEFMGSNLAGYFEGKVTDMRYDYPDPGAESFRADATLLFEFKNLAGEVIWKGEFQGPGVGYINPDVRISPFDQASGIAVQEAFDHAVDKAEDAIRNSTTLRDYFRRSMGSPVNPVPAEPAEQEPTA
jgi:hypothetical protein